MYIILMQAHNQSRDQSRDPSRNMQSRDEKILKDQGLSLTAVRLALLDALRVRPHSEAGHIFNLVKSKITTTSKQAIYNNLSRLVECGIIREIHPKGRSSLYETRTGDNHHHIVCRHCQLIIDTDCLAAAPCLVPKDNHGFIIDEAEVTLWGLCPSCQKLKT